MARILGLATLLACGLACSVVRAEDCGNPYDSPGRFGPFDYTDPTKGQELHLVEIAHFTPYMEEVALYGFSSRRAQGPNEVTGHGLIAGNFDYTLHAFPNHSKALYAMGIWQLRSRQESPTFRQSLGDVYSAECYFERAIMFRPDDSMVHHAYGAFLQKAGDLKKAAEQYQTAIALMPDAPEPHYNLGLLYVDLGDYDKASEQAARAYELGYPLQGLKRKLDQAQQRRHQ